MNKGFSLVELSVVLVILGLLTGGVLTGQSLIRASELRAITNEFQQYQTAVNTFKNKYFALPGDITNATSFWGDNTAVCSDAAIPNGSPGTCNGNGNGGVFEGGGTSQETEFFMFWQHLSNAGLLEGAFTGIAGTGSNYHSTIGTNIPASKYSGGGWFVGTLDRSGDGVWFDGRYGNFFQIGAALANDAPEAYFLTPEAAWNIDKKIDDGKPGKGSVVALGWDDECADGSSANDFDADYRVNDTSLQCALSFRNMF
jgi:prepilin-type N-terminal cleavage/methylation domain-containing protein